MIYQLVVPGPIEDVDELRVLEWHGSEGDTFAPGQMIVELETHKAVVEVRSARAGILRRVLCPPGEWQKIGLPLAYFSDTPIEPLPGNEADAPVLLVNYEIV